MRLWHSGRSVGPEDLAMAIDTIIEDKDGPWKWDEWGPPLRPGMVERGRG